MRSPDLPPQSLSPNSVRQATGRQTGRTAVLRSWIMA